MIHDEAKVARLLPEPDNGTVLVVDNGSHEYRVIWRDDAEAKRWDSHPGDRWFNDPTSDPMALYQHVKYAMRVYELAGEPLVDFGEASQ